MSPQACLVHASLCGSAWKAFFFPFFHFVTACSLFQANFPHVSAWSLGLRGPPGTLSKPLQLPGFPPTALGTFESALFPISRW